MRLLSWLILCFCCALGTAAGAAERVTVFAASSLADVLQEIATAYEKNNDFVITFSFASSSTLARQVEAGAPADLVALASLDWAGYLAERGLIRPETEISPIGNRLAIVAPADSALALSDAPTAAEILAALGPHGRLAVGDPAHVPAGIYAREALTSLGLWDVLVPRLAPTDNVRAALALVSHGEAPLGIVYDTDIRAAPGVRLLQLLPEQSHAPITYAFAAVTSGDPDTALPFLDFLSGAEARAMFARHGFSLR